MHCKSCNHEITNEDIFCPSCGENVVVYSDLTLSNASNKIQDFIKQYNENQSRIGGKEIDLRILLRFITNMTAKEKSLFAKQLFGAKTELIHKKLHSLLSKRESEAILEKKVRYTEEGIDQEIAEFETEESHRIGQRKQTTAERDYEGDALEYYHGRSEYYRKEHE